MMIWEYIKHSVCNMKRKSFKTILTIISIGIATASVVLITAISYTGKDAISSEMASLGMDGIMISADRKNMLADLGLEELESIRSSNHVECAAPVTVNYTEAKMRGLVANTLVWGIDQTAPDVISLSLKYGRLFNKSDIAQSRSVCVVDENFSKAFYKRENIVGKEIRLLLPDGYEYFTVIGVVQSGGNILQGLMDGYIPSFVYIPYSASQNTNTAQFDQIVVRVKNGHAAEQTGEDLSHLLDNINHVSRGYHVENILQQKQSIDNMMNIFTVVLSGIAGISLVVAGLGIMTVMLVSVSERTQEIGIKKSLGASKKIIVTEFLIEASLLSLIGGILGIVIGNILAFLGCNIFGITYHYRILPDIYFLIITLIVGIGFGVYPALRAADLNPVDALRHD